MSFSCFTAVNTSVDYQIGNHEGASVLKTEAFLTNSRRRHKMCRPGRKHLGHIALVL